MDTEKIISELKLPTFLHKCLDNCAELKHWMSEILPGAQAQYTVKYFQSLSSCHSD